MRKLRLDEVFSLDRVLPLVLTGSATGMTITSAAATRPVAGIVYRPFTDPRPLWRPPPHPSQLES